MIDQVENTTQAVASPRRTFRIPVSSGIFSHYPKMRDSFWLFVWYIDRTTKEIDGEPGERLGVVSGGAPVRDFQIAAEFGCEKRTICRWRNRLARLGYIRQRITPFGTVVWVKKSKKWNFDSRDKNVPLHKTSGTRSVAGGTEMSRGGTRSALAKKTLQTVQNSKEKQEGASRLSVLIDGVLVVYGKVEIKPQLGSAERRKLGELLKNHTAKEILSALRLFLLTDDAWLIENRYPINAFAKRFDKLLEQVAENDRRRTQEEFERDFYPYFDPSSYVEIDSKNRYNEWMSDGHLPRENAEERIASGKARKSAKRTLPTDTVHVLSRYGSEGWLDRGQLQHYVELGMCTEIKSKQEAKAC